MTKRSNLLWIIPALIVVVFGYYVLAFGRLAVNATDSLPENAFAMVTWPKILWRGAVVAVEVPDPIAGQFAGQDVYLTKRLVGLPGDPVTRDGDRICVGEACVKGHRKNGQLVAPLWQASVVPDGSIAIFGESPDSLDSRYDIIGAVPTETIEAVGIAIPFPHWKRLAEWLQ